MESGSTNMRPSSHKKILDMIKSDMLSHFFLIVHNICHKLSDNIMYAMATHCLVIHFSNDGHIFFTCCLLVLSVDKLLQTHVAFFAYEKQSDFG